MVKIMYSSSVSFIPRPSLEGAIDGEVLPHLWESFAPSKLLFSRGSCFWDIYQQEVSLLKRGDRGEGPRFVHCQGKSEEESRIFFI